MCRGDCQRNVESDDYKAYKEIEEQIGHCTPEQAWAMYYVSAGLVREHIALAVMEHITRGNKALLLEFPELAQAEKERIRVELTRIKNVFSAKESPMADEKRFLQTVQSLHRRRYQG